MTMQIPPNEPSPPYPGTLIETEEDIRRALLADKAAIPLAGPITKKTPVAPTAPPKSPEVKPYRPTVRPPICVLTLFDDGKTEGEVVRIRSTRFVIGRSDGDLLLPHDEQISNEASPQTDEACYNDSDIATKAISEGCIPLRATA